MDLYVGNNVSEESTASETLVHTYKSTRRHNPEDHNGHK
jgi:hypothetical protein